MVEILAIIWRVSMLACFVVFFAVIVTIIDARKRPEPVLMPSVWMWVLGSIFGGILWVGIIGALFGFGFDHSGNRGVWGIIGKLILQVGPILYVWSGYQIVGAARRSSNQP